MLKSRKSGVGAKRSNSASLSSSSSSDNKNSKSSTYRWVGRGEPQSDGTVVYSALEATVAGRKSLIRCGDSALLSSGNVEELEDAVLHAVSNENPTNPDEEEHLLAEDEEDSFYGSHTDEDFRSICALDPFVAVIVKMWEVPPLVKPKGKRKSIMDVDVFDDERKVRMKVRARWYFKKEDVAGMNGWFQGMPKKALLSSMGPRDLVLSEHSDDNEVPTILGRCRVARRPPLVKPSKDGPLLDEEIPQGVYVCRHNVRIPSKGEIGFGYVVVEPYKGEPFDDEVLEQQQSITKAALIPSQGKITAKVQTTDSVSDASQQGEKEGGEEMSVDDYPQHGPKRPNAPKIMGPKLIPDIDVFLDHSPVKTLFQFLPQIIKPVQNDVGTLAHLETHVEIISPTIGLLIKGEADAENTPITSSGTLSVTSSTADQMGSSSTSSSSSEDEEDAEDGGLMKIDDAENFLPGSPRKQVGIIHVGENHQAFVPPLASVQEQSSYGNQSMATRCWMPGKISDDKLKKYLSESRRILKLFVESQGEDYTFEPETVCIPPCSLLESDHPAPRGATWLKKNLARECNGDELHDELYRNDYSLPAALAVVAQFPKEFLALWNISERQKFELGFQQVCGVLRSIAKLIPSKDSKDVVDYHYRFKIPEQFRKYEEQKMKQARRMITTADLRLLDSVAAGGKGGANVKKVRNWTNSGATEQRRVLAKEFLVRTRDSVGTERYLMLANNLKLYHTKELSIAQLKENITKILKGRPDLVERFNDFLPKKLRTVL